VQAAFERDRAKDLALRELGMDPHRYTHRQVNHQAARVAAALRRALGVRTARGISR
jgi:acyl-coenzyme A synthetase/AMP-(fatty) acid ligase